jgi:CRP/FNR family transcriptional regulator
VGVPATVSGRPYELSAEALEAVEAKFIRREAFLHYLQEHGDVALQVAAIISEKLGATLHQLRCLGFSASTSERLARFLLELPVVEGHDDGTRTTVPLTHKDIAEMIGSSRETVTRILNHFKRQHLVEIQGSTLSVIDRDGLKKLLDFEKPSPELHYIADLPDDAVHKEMSFTCD